MIKTDLSLWLISVLGAIIITNAHATEEEIAMLVFQDALHFM